MALILKFPGFFFSVMAVAALSIMFIGNDRLTLNEKEEFQNNPGETPDLYKMYFNFDGDRSQIIFLIKGKAELKMVYPGKTKFTAKLMRTNGSLLRLLADEIGPYDRNQIIDIPETGTYLFVVKTTGELSLSGE